MYAGPRSILRAKFEYSQASGKRNGQSSPPAAPLFHFQVDNLSLHLVSPATSVLKSLFFSQAKGELQTAERVMKIVLGNQLCSCCYTTGETFGWRERRSVILGYMHAEREGKTFRLAISSSMHRYPFIYIQSMLVSPAQACVLMTEHSRPELLGTGSSLRAPKHGHQISVRVPTHMSIHTYTAT